MGNSTQKLKYRFLLITFVTIVVFIMAGSAALWFFFPAEKFRSFLTQEISRRINQEVAIEQLSIAFYPDPELVAYHVRIVDAITKQEIISCEKVRLNFKLWMLIKRKLALDAISVSSLVLSIVRNPDGSLNTAKLFKDIQSEIASHDKKPAPSASAAELEIDRIQLWNGTVKFEDAESGRSVIAHNIDTVYEVAEDKLSLSFDSLIFPEGTAKLTGVFTQLLSPDPAVDASMTMHLKKGGFLQKAVSTGLPDGTIIADLTLKASGALSAPRISAEFSLNPEATARIATKGTVVSRLQAKDGILKIEPLKVSFGASTLSLSGTLSQVFSAEPICDVSFTAQVHADDYLKQIVPAAVSVGAPIADLSIKASGSVFKTKINATVSINPKATADIATRGTVIGMLQAKEGVFAIDALKGSAGKSTFSLSGRLNNFFSKDWNAFLQGTVDPDLKEALTLAGKDIAAKLEPQGKAAAVVDIFASSRQSSLKARCNLKDSAFTIPAVMRKPTGTPGNLVVSARYVPSGELVIDPFSLQIGKAELSGTLQINPGKEPWLQAQIKTADAPLVTLNQLPAVKFDKGTASISTKIWCQKPSAETTQYKGVATIKNATVLVQCLSKAFKNLAATIDFENQKAVVRDTSFMLGKSLYKAEAVIESFSAQRISGKLHTNVLDLDEITNLFAGQDDSASSTSATAQKGVQDFSSQVLIEADSVLAGSITTGRTSTTWYASGTAHRFEPVIIKAFDGMLQGKFALGVKDTEVTWTADFSGHDMNLKKISDCLSNSDTRGKISGLLGGEGHLQGIGASRKEDVLNSINGECNLTAVKGEITNSQLLNSMLFATRFSFATWVIPGIREINLINTALDTVRTKGRNLELNTIPYDRIDGSFQIAKGIAHAKKTYLTGKTLELLSQGDIDMINEKIDLKIKITPVSTAGDLAGKIPLLGKEIKKIQKSFLSYDFNARGTIANPEIKVTKIEKLKSDIEKLPEKLY
jgi:hypothetical protein